MTNEGRRGAGGTPGGVGEFFGGLALAAVGIYLVFNRVIVHTGYWSFGGVTHPFGVSLIPLIVGVILLFINGRSPLGWALTAGGILFILAGVLLNMDIYFQSTDLVTVLIMVVMMASGFGLMFRSLRAH